MTHAVLVAFLLVPPVLQLVWLLIALRRGVARGLLIAVSVVIGIALAASGVLIDVGRTAGEGPATPVHDWTVGALLGTAIIVETLIVVYLVEVRRD